MTVKCIKSSFTNLRLSHLIFYFFSSFFLGKPSHTPWFHVDLKCRSVLHMQPRRYKKTHLVLYYYPPESLPESLGLGFCAILQLSSTFLGPSWIPHKSRPYSVFTAQAMAVETESCRRVVPWKWMRFGGQKWHVCAPSLWRFFTWQTFDNFFCTTVYDDVHSIPVHGKFCHVKIKKQTFIFRPQGSMSYTCIQHVSHPNHSCRIYDPVIIMQNRPSSMSIFNPAALNISQCNYALLACICLAVINCALGREFYGV